MSVSNGIITAPVSIEDVCTALGITYNSNNADSGTLCLNTRINPLARYKPTEYGSIPKRTKTTFVYIQCTSESIFRNGRKYYTKSGSTYTEAVGLNATTFNANKTNYWFRSYNEDHSIICGVAYYSGNSVIPKPNVIPSVTFKNYGSASNYGWYSTYGAPIWNLKQTPTYYRLADFNGYDHNASLNYEPHFFEPRSYTDTADNRTSSTITGVFYDITYMPILSFNRSDANAMSMDANNLPVHCWEDNDGGQYISSLKLEEIIASLKSSTGTIENFLDMYIGLGLTFPDKSLTDWYLFNTGYTFKSVFVGDSSHPIINPTYISINNINVAELTLANSSLTMSVDFVKLSKCDNWNFLPEGSHGSVRVKSKILAIYGSSGGPWIHKNSNELLYSFEVKSGFCSADTTMINYIPLSVTWKYGLQLNIVQSGSGSYNTSNGIWTYSGLLFTISRSAIQERYKWSGSKTVYFKPFVEYTVGTEGVSNSYYYKLYNSETKYYYTKLDGTHTTHELTTFNYTLDVGEETGNRTIGVIPIITYNSSNVMAKLANSAIIKIYIDSSSNGSFSTLFETIYIQAG